jgi:hypothetical protein
VERRQSGQHCVSIRRLEVEARGLLERGVPDLMPQDGDPDQFRRDQSRLGSGSSGAGQGARGIGRASIGVGVTGEGVGQRE